jgi:DNA-binding transcriptional MerR regulator
MQKIIPDKLYFKIGEVAKMADVPTHVLRYWESEFAEIKPKRANSKQRLYRRQDVELILKVKVLLHEQGYTIAGARKFITSGADVQQTVPGKQPLSRNKFGAKLSAIKNDLKELQTLLDNEPK